MDIELPTPAPAAEPALPTPEPVEPAAEPVAAAPEPAAEPVAEPEPEPEPAAPAPAKKGGMLQELIETRQRATRAEGALKSLQPTLDRLTPDIARAIQEGRVIVKPPQAAPDAERERLTQVAQDLGLFKADNTPDTDAAARVDRYVRSTVREQVAPVQQVTLEGQANKHMSAIWARAQADGLSPEAMAIIHEEFSEVIRQPTGAQMLAQELVAETVYDRALGKAFRAGKLTGAPAPKPKPAGPAAIITEPAGRRGPATAAIQLSPALAKVYADNGIDPNKTKPPQVDARGHMELK